MFAVKELQPIAPVLVILLAFICRLPPETVNPVCAVIRPATVRVPLLLTARFPPETVNPFCAVRVPPKTVNPLVQVTPPVKLIVLFNPSIVILVVGVSVPFVVPPAPSMVLLSLMRRPEQFVDNVVNIRTSLYNVP